jgi:cytoskeletal protein RodZ
MKIRGKDQKSPYIFGNRPEPKRHGVRTFFVSFLVICLVLAGAAWWFFVRGHAPDGINNSAASISQTKAPKKNHIDEKYFSIDLPKDWKMALAQTSPFIQYSFHATAKHASARTLNIFVDYVPPNLGLNTLQIIKADGNKITLGPRSPDCGNLLKQTPKSANTSTKLTTATWHGLHFLCNPAPFSRAIGTGSKASGSQKTYFVGQKTGRHSFYFLYIDDTIHPKPGLFSKILHSFRAK